MVALYSALVSDIPEDYEELLYMIFSSESPDALKTWLKTLTAEEKHITVVIKDLILLIDNDIINSTRLAREMLENVGVSFKE